MKDWVLRFPFGHKMDTHDCGRVIQIGGGTVHLDFGDRQFEFCKTDIVFGIHSVTGKESFITVAAGRFISEYQSNPTGLSMPGSDPELDAMVAILDRIIEDSNEASKQRPARRGNRRSFGKDSVHG
jgi:hypothetical protein